MAVTLDGIDIETITRINEIQRPLVSPTAIGVHSLLVAPNLKSTLHQYDVVGVWSAGATDYNNKLRKLQNLVDSGLPIWLDATDWRNAKLLFGKISDFATLEDEGAVDIYRFSFIMTAVPSIGYLFVQDSGAGLGKVYDVDTGITRGLSDTFNPLLRRGNVTKSSTSMTYSFFVKNVGVSSGAIVIEIMVPDEVNSGNVATKLTASAGWTKAAGTVGTAGFSSSPGTKQRATITKTLGAGIAEQVDITLSFVSDRVSYLDGSIDETAI